MADTSVVETYSWQFQSDGAENASGNLLGTVNTNIELDTATTYFFRIGIAESSGTYTRKNLTPQLQYNYQSGGWNDVNATSSYVQSIATANVTDGADTSQLITGAEFTHDTTQGFFDEVDGLGGDANADFNGTGAEAVFSIQIVDADVTDAHTFQLRVVDTIAGNPYDTDNQTSPTVTVNKTAGVNELLADDVQSTSEVSSPVITQVHALLANDVQSTSEVSLPTASESHILLADDVESTSEVTAPAITQVHNLLANSVESASETSSPTVTQIHTLLANDTESASEVSIPVITQAHVLLADDVESTSEVSSPAFGCPMITLVTDVTKGTLVLSQDGSFTYDYTAGTPPDSDSFVYRITDINGDSGNATVTLTITSTENVLLADDIESASEVSSPIIGQIHSLTSVSIESTSEVSNPVIAQVHVLTANSVESASEVSNPVLTSVAGENVLLADDVESASEVSTPVLAQVHNLFANNAESASEVSSPGLTQVHVLAANDVQSTSEVSSPVLFSGVVFENAEMLWTMKPKHINLVERKIVLRG